MCRLLNATKGLHVVDNLICADYCQLPCKVASVLEKDDGTVCIAFLVCEAVQQLKKETLVLNVNCGHHRVLGL